MAAQPAVMERITVLATL